MTENEKVGWHHWLKGLREFVMDREAWSAAVHMFSKTWAHCSDLVTEQPQQSLIEAVRWEVTFQDYTRHLSFCGDRLSIARGLNLGDPPAWCRGPCQDHQKADELLSARRCFPSGTTQLAPSSSYLFLPPLGLVAIFPLKWACSMSSNKKYYDLTSCGFMRYKSVVTLQI